jgi:hypothetical protein
MNIKQLQAARNAMHFVPFTIFLADGRSPSFLHPDNLSISAGDRIVIVLRPVEARSLLKMSLVTDIEVKHSLPTHKYWRAPHEPEARHLNLLTRRNFVDSAAYLA